LACLPFGEKLKIYPEQQRKSNLAGGVNIRRSKNKDQAIRAVIDAPGAGLIPGTDFHSIQSPVSWFRSIKCPFSSNHAEAVIVYIGEKG
jgi:hypothetical protein